MTPRRPTDRLGTARQKKRLTLARTTGATVVNACMRTFGTSSESVADWSEFLCCSAPDFSYFVNLYERECKFSDPDRSRLTSSDLGPASKFLISRGPERR